MKALFVRKASPALARELAAFERRMVEEIERLSVDLVVMKSAYLLETGTEEGFEEEASERLGLEVGGIYLCLDYAGAPAEERAGMVEEFLRYLMMGEPGRRRPVRRRPLRPIHGIKTRRGLR